ncbi:hypothetical protein JL101_015510 [Skermanella rosea]|uniref:hypothetical protein n=1 Tax=Skermanella rosea TaxID=1817965 RepID=UPI0019312825|nr:hypothetical protein [Skermanella rosea]UEM01416.1 hypothetical protein JL101_015510 [Skermanella rosea]
MAEQQSDKELENYIREKQEEGRRINEGRAHPVENPDPPSFQGQQAARAGLRRGDRDVPSDAEGQDRAGRIEQTITSDGYTQTQ